jgi:hypothetical protein
LLGIRSIVAKPPRSCEPVPMPAVTDMFCSPTVGQQESEEVPGNWRGRCSRIVLTSPPSALRIHLPLRPSRTLDLPTCDAVYNSRWEQGGWGNMRPRKSLSRWSRSQ